MTEALFPYEIEGADFLASKRRAGLFDDPGGGKTAQTIAALDKLRLTRGIIVAPAGVHAAGVWTGEFRKFSTVPRKILKGSELHHLNLWLRGKIDVLLLTYTMAGKWAKRLEGDVFDFIVFDESHRLKNKQTDWTRAMLGADCDGRYGLARWASRAWFLTGTPNPNDSSDLWSTMRFCRATPCSHRIFTDRYFRKRVGTYSTSYEIRDEMVEELKLAVKSFSLRRTEREFGLQLPPIWLTTINVDGDSEPVRALLRAHPNLEDAIKEAVEKGGLSFLESQHVMTLRRLVAEAKAPAFTELLVEELENGLERCVVFGVHRRAFDHIESGLRSRGRTVCRFDGRTDEKSRKDAVQRFARGDVEVFLANIQSGGLGLNELVVANHVTMFESDWTPAANAQALKRVRRRGQTKEVHARFVVLANSIDEYVQRVVARKTRDIIKLGTFSEIAA